MRNINILVICTGNSCRSQIAEGYLKYFSKQLNMNTNVYSAGIRAEGINKKAIEIMFTKVSVLYRVFNLLIFTGQ